MRTTLAMTGSADYTVNPGAETDQGEVLSSGVPVDFAPGLNGDPDDDWDEFTTEIGLKSQLTDDAMLYATWSNGYRSGGFNTRVGSYSEAVTPYDQETVESYELGFKSAWCDNMVHVNGNVFYMEYEDKQEELHLPDELSGTGQKTVVANASTAEISVTATGRPSR